MLVPTECHAYYIPCNVSVCIYNRDVHVTMIYMFPHAPLNVRCYVLCCANTVLSARPWTPRKYLYHMDYKILSHELHFCHKIHLHYNFITWFLLNHNFITWLISHGFQVCHLIFIWITNLSHAIHMHYSLITCFHIYSAI